MWCIPPEQDAEFVAAMEQVLEVYKRPYDPRFPVVCMDEQSKQLIEEVREPRATEPGRPARYDVEYKRHGTTVLWMFNEPLGQWRDVRVSSFPGRRTAVDWARQVKALVDDPRYAEGSGVERITLVCDQLNTHRMSSLYKAFGPAEAARLRQRLELVHTPKHGSWLNMAESELSTLTRQCLSRRIAREDEIRTEVEAWRDRRNAQQVGVDWQFTTDQARIKLKHLYPKIED